MKSGEMGGDDAAAGNGDQPELPGGLDLPDASGVDPSDAGVAEDGPSTREIKIPSGEPSAMQEYDETQEIEPVRDDPDAIPWPGLHESRDVTDPTPGILGDLVARYGNRSSSDDIATHAGDGRVGGEVTAAGVRVPPGASPEDIEGDVRVDQFARIHAHITTTALNTGHNPAQHGVTVSSEDSLDDTKTGTERIFADSHVQDGTGSSMVRYRSASDFKGVEMGTVTTVTLQGGELHTGTVFTSDGETLDTLREEGDHNSYTTGDALTLLSRLVGVEPLEELPTDPEESQDDKRPDITAQQLDMEESDVTGALTHEGNEHEEHHQDIQERIGDLGGLEGAAFRQSYGDLMRQYSRVNRVTGRVEFDLVSFERERLQELIESKFPPDVHGCVPPERPLTNDAILRYVPDISIGYDIDVLSMSRAEFYLFVHNLVEGAHAFHAELSEAEVTAPFRVLDAEFSPQERYAIYGHVAGNWFNYARGKELIGQSTPMTDPGGQMRLSDLELIEGIVDGLRAVSMDIPEARTLLYDAAIAQVADKDPNNHFARSRLSKYLSEALTIDLEGTLTRTPDGQSLIADVTGLAFYVDKLPELKSLRTSLHYDRHHAIATVVTTLIDRITQYQGYGFYAAED